MTSPATRQARLFTVTVCGVLAIYAALGFSLLPLATFQGDLTRIALIPEKEFGWRLPQPALTPDLLQQASLSEADVLVIGDSFSDNPGQHNLSRVWQSVLLKKKMKVRTEKWDNYGGVCADLLPWLRDHGFRGHTLVLESVERGLLTNLDNSIACSNTHYRTHAVTDETRPLPETSFEPAYGDYNGKLSTGYLTLYHSVHYQTVSQQAGFSSMPLSNHVKLARVPDGCKKFSHLSCSDALFLEEDRAEEIDSAALQRMRSIQDRMPGIRVLWAIVPNKTTVYLHPEKQFWRKAAQQLNAPDLLDMTQQALTCGMVDLYPANNTHFSTSGYLLMGETIYTALGTKP